MICNLRKTTLILFALFFLCGCHPGFIVPSTVDVFIKKSVRPFLITGHLVILPFECPGASSEPGREVALQLKENITRIDYLKKVTPIEEAPWRKQIETRYDRLQKTLKIARQTEADLVLTGSVEGVLFGNLDETATTISARLLSVKTGKTLWWGKHRVTGKSGKTFFLLDAMLPADPPDLHRLLTYSADKITSEIFPKSDLLLKYVITRDPETDKPFEKPYASLETSDQSTDNDTDDDESDEGPLDVPLIIGDTVSTKDILKEALGDLNTNNSSR